MNQEETIALWKQGKEAWNAWAQKILDARKALEDEGKWQVNTRPSGDPKPSNEETAKWFEDARSVFSSKETPYTFPNAIFLEGFLFPSVSDWSAATFKGDASFESVTFKDVANFESATFEGVAWFKSATFKGVARFASGTFKDDAWFESATFEGRAGFESATFKGVARFTCADVEVDGWFESATFEGDAWFDSAIFKDYSWFESAIFKNDAWFESAIFKDYAWFDSATFKGDAWFKSATFADDVWFKNATFEAVAWFDSATFKDRAGFESTTFEGRAGFESATFEGVATFESATFEGGVGFSSVCFEKPALFSVTQFYGNTSFNSAQIKQAFDLSGARFKEVPDFRQTHCEEAPLLDDVNIGSTIIKQRKSSHDPDFTVTANYRALKRLAIQGHDHKHEVEFFAEELRSKRLMVDKRWHWDWILSGIFQITSDYGRSILRPFLFWLLVVGLSATTYLLTAKQPASNVALQCVKSEGWQWVSAIQLAIGKGLLFPGIADRTLIMQAYDCLYGGAIPALTSTALGLQTLVSSALLFLILLGIRNRFKLK